MGIVFRDDIILDYNMFFYIYVYLENEEEKVFLLLIILSVEKSNFFINC